MKQLTTVAIAASEPFVFFVSYIGLCKVKYKSYNTACSGFDGYIYTLSPCALKSRAYIPVKPLAAVL